MRYIGRALERHAPGERSIGTMPERMTQSKIPLKQVYKAEDVGHLDADTALSDPGSYPFTRGRRLDLYSGGGWIQRELSGEGDAGTSNAQFKYLLEMGQTGLDVIGDTPTMDLLDPDHPFAKYAIGSQGVSLCCLQDYRELYQDIPLNQITLSHSLPSYFCLPALYLVAKDNGYDPSKMRGSLVQTPLYQDDCGYSVHWPLDLRVRLSSDTIEFCAKEMPKFHSFLEDTYYFSESGLDSVEEMALGFVEIRHIVRDLLARGVDIDSFAPRIAILVNCRMDLFEEVAKIRATRRLFAKMMREEFGAQDPRSWAVAITSHTSGLTLTAQQPVNNIVRGTIEAMALAMAGVQAIEISAFDEAFRTPSPESHFIGLRTQQILNLESNVTKVTDPLGGSYYVESLTDDIEQRVWDMVIKIEAAGSISELAERGYFRDILTNAMERYSKDVENKELWKVGVNIHQIPDEEDTLLKEVAEQKIEPYLSRIERIQELKGARDLRQIERTLRVCCEQARAPNGNLMPSIMDATRAGATMGEIAGALRLAYGGPYDPYGMVEPPVELQ